MFSMRLWRIFFLSVSIGLALGLTGCQKAEETESETVAKKKAKKAEEEAATPEAVMKRLEKLKAKSKKAKTERKAGSLALLGEPFTFEELSLLLPNAPEGWRTSKATGLSGKGKRDPVTSFARRRYKESDSAAVVNVTLWDVYGQSDRAATVKHRAKMMSEKREVVSKPIREEDMRGVRYYHEASGQLLALLVLQSRLFLEIDCKHIRNEKAAQPFFALLDFDAMRKALKQKRKEAR